MAPPKLPTAAGNAAAKIDGRAHAVGFEDVHQLGVANMPIIDGNDHARTAMRGAVDIGKSDRFGYGQQILQMHVQGLGFRVVIDQDQDSISPKQRPDHPDRAAP
jgi:hypothetical protein